MCKIFNTFNKIYCIYILMVDKYYIWPVYLVFSLKEYDLNRKNLNIVCWPVGQGVYHFKCSLSSKRISRIAIKTLHFSYNSQKQKEK